MLSLVLLELAMIWIGICTMIVINPLTFSTTAEFLVNAWLEFVSLNLRRRGFFRELILLRVRFIGL